MSNVILTGMWHCQDCGETGAAEPVEDRETFYAPHDCALGQNEQ
jgi:hypothetical protein